VTKKVFLTFDPNLCLWWIYFAFWRFFKRRSEKTYFNFEYLILHTTTTAKFFFVFEMSFYYETLVEMFRQKDFRFFNQNFCRSNFFLLKLRDVGLTSNRKYLIKFELNKPKLTIIYQFFEANFEFRLFTKFLSFLKFVSLKFVNAPENVFVVNLYVVWYHRDKWRNRVCYQYYLARQSQTRGLRTSKNSVVF